MEIKTVAIVGMGALGMLYGEQLQKVCQQEQCAL